MSFGLAGHLASTGRWLAFQYAFLVNASLLAAGGVVIFFGLVSRPKQIGKRFLPGVWSWNENTPAYLSGVQEPSEGHNQDTTKALLPTSASDASISGTEKHGEAISFWRAFMLPGVIAVRNLVYRLRFSVSLAFRFSIQRHTLV